MARERLGEPPLWEAFSHQPRDAVMKALADRAPTIRSGSKDRALGKRIVKIGVPLALGITALLPVAACSYNSGVPLDQQATALGEAAGISPAEAKTILLTKKSEALDDQTDKLAEKEDVTFIEAREKILAKYGSTPDERATYFARFHSLTVEESRDILMGRYRLTLDQRAAAIAREVAEMSFDEVKKLGLSKYRGAHKESIIKYATSHNMTIPQAEKTILDKYGATLEEGLAKYAELHGLTVDEAKEVWGVK